MPGYTRVPSLLNRHLTMTCSIALRDDDAEDDDGLPVPNFGTPVDGINCRVVDLEEDELAGSRLGNVVLYTDAILFAQATPVAQRARITDIKEADNSDYDAGPFEVVDVRQRRVNNPVFKRVLVKRAE